MTDSAPNTSSTSSKSWYCWVGLLIYAISLLYTGLALLCIIGIIMTGSQEAIFDFCSMFIFGLYPKPAAGTEGGEASGSYLFAFLCLGSIEFIIGALIFAVKRYVLDRKFGSSA